MLYVFHNIVLNFYTSSIELFVSDFSFAVFQVDAMLQKLEKEIDDVDARIGNRWQLLDR
jgi:hypothetical protein